MRAHHYLERGPGISHDKVQRCLFSRMVLLCTDIYKFAFLITSHHACMYFDVLWVGRHCWTLSMLSGRPDREQGGK